MDIALGYVPRSGIVGSCGKSRFNLLRNCQTFPQLQHFTIPPAVNKKILVSIDSCQLFFFLNYGQTECEVVSHYGFFFCISLTANDFEHFFHVSRCSLYVLFGEMSVQSKNF